MATTKAVALTKDPRAHLQLLWQQTPRAKSRHSRSGAAHSLRPPVSTRPRPRTFSNSVTDDKLKVLLTNSGLLLAAEVWREQPMGCTSSCLSAHIPSHVACPDALQSVPCSRHTPVTGSHSKGLIKDAFQPTDLSAVVRWALKLLLCHTVGRIFLKGTLSS